MTEEEKKAMKKNLFNLKLAQALYTAEYKEPSRLLENQYKIAKKQYAKALYIEKEEKEDEKYKGK